LPAFTIAALYTPLADASTWLFASQGRGKDWLFASSLVSLITVASFVAGLPFGPAGVRHRLFRCRSLVGLPFFTILQDDKACPLQLICGSEFSANLPLWAVVCGATWLMRLLFSNSAPFGAIGPLRSSWSLAGLILIWVLTPMRRTALGLV